MKITVDVDITPEELRKFLGLPKIEKLQEEMLKAAQKRLAESGQSMVSDLMTGAVQPMMAYQQWLQRMMAGASSSRGESRRESKSESKPEPESESKTSSNKEH